MIKRLLVANRGEVAVRIMATASVLGIETVAVYPADDAACGHVDRADASVELPGTGAAAYLDVDAIMAAAAGPACASPDRGRRHWRCSATRPRPEPGQRSWACRCWPVPVPIPCRRKHEPCCASTARSWSRRWPGAAGAACAR